MSLLTDLHCLLLEVCLQEGALGPLPATTMNRLQFGSIVGSVSGLSRFFAGIPTASR